VIFDPPTGRVFTADARSDTVTVLDAATRRQLARVPVGSAVARTTTPNDATLAISGRDGRAAASSGLVGLGVGASVSPALFITGFSLRPAQIQRVFALVELLRGVTAFLVAPVLLYLAAAIGASVMAGIRVSAWICLVIAAGGALLVTVLFVLGGGRLRAPDLERWAGGEPAWTSPPLLGRLSQVPAPEEHARRPSAADTGARFGRVWR
jgi:YVTN family beta-propeller protein